MTDDFAETIAPLITYGIGFHERLRQNEHPALDAEKRLLLKLLEKATKRAAATPELARDFALASHALIYWIDDVLINSDWEHALAWRSAILEIDVYGPPRRAAKEFWARADQAERQARDGEGKDPLETFYVCAALGFRGQLCLDESGLFVRWFQRIHHLLGSPLPLMEDAEDDPRWGLRPLPGGALLVGFSVLFFATALVTILSFIAAVHMST